MSEGGDFKISFKEFQEFLGEYEIKKVKQGFFDKISTVIFVALGLITALAWEDTFHSIFVFIFGGIESIGQKTLYALIITLITVLVSVYFGKYFTHRTRKH